MWANDNKLEGVYSDSYLFRNKDIPFICYRRGTSEIKAAASISRETQLGFPSGEKQGMGDEKGLASTVFQIPWAHISERCVLSPVTHSRKYG